MPPFLQTDPNITYINIKNNNFTCPVPSWCSYEGSGECEPCTMLISMTTTTTLSPSPSITSTASTTPTGSNTATSSSTQTATPSPAVYTNITFYYLETQSNIWIILLILGVILVPFFTFLLFYLKKRKDNSVDTQPLIPSETNPHETNFVTTKKNQIVLILIMGLEIDFLGLRLIPNILLLILPKVECSVGAPKIEFIFALVFLFGSIVSGIIIDKLKNNENNSKLKTYLIIVILFQVVFKFFEFIFSLCFPEINQWVIYTFSLLSFLFLNVASIILWSILKIQIKAQNLDPKEETKQINIT